jgi:hypothetical protein
LLIDTNLPEDAEIGTFPTGELYGVTGRSLLLFALESDTNQRNMEGPEQTGKPSGRYPVCDVSMFPVAQSSRPVASATCGSGPSLSA